MDEREKEHVRQWIWNWEAAGPMLERLRDEAIRNTDTAAAMMDASAYYVPQEQGGRRTHFAPCTHASHTKSKWLDMPVIS